MMKCLSQKFLGTELDENEDNLSEKCKYHLKQYRSICESIQEADVKWKEDIDYYDSRHKSLLQKLHETNLGLEEMTQKLKSLGFDSNHDLNNIRKVTLNISDEVSDEWLEIMDLCKKVTSMIYFCNSVLEKNDNDQVLNLTKLAESLNSKYLANGQLDIEQLYLDLKPFLSSIEFSLSSFKSKLPEVNTINERLGLILKELDKQMEEMKGLETQLEEKLKSVKMALTEKRDLLLNSAKVKSRRQWFADQLPLNLLPSLDFKLESNKPLENDIFQAKTPSTPSDHSSRRQSKLCHEFDYSFQPFDMTLTYIPPSAPDRILLSPLRTMSSITEECLNTFDQVKNE